MCSSGRLHSLLACSDAAGIKAAAMSFGELNDPDAIKVKLEGNAIRRGSLWCLCAAGSSVSRRLVIFLGCFPAVASVLF